MAQGGPDASHTTLVGHSYGSTVIGAAALELGRIATTDYWKPGSKSLLNQARVIVGNYDDATNG